MTYSDKFGGQLIFYFLESRKNKIKIVKSALSKTSNSPFKSLLPLLLGTYGVP